MTALILHETTREAVNRFIAHPGHALLLSAPAGAGKSAVMYEVAAALLRVAPETLMHHPYFTLISPPAGKNIPISAIREIIHATTLRTPASTGVSRVILLEHADAMTAQAQNALLKTIEEPPIGTVLLLTATSDQAILPTIRSRVQRWQLCPPDIEAVRTFFEHQGYAPDFVGKALLMSGGLPGLMHTLLAEDATHPLFAATTIARALLQKSSFERVVYIDELAGQRELWLDVLFIVGQMATTAIRLNQGDTAAYRRWQRILAAVHTAQGQTMANAQLKLVLLQFMLTL